MNLYIADNYLGRSLVICFNSYPNSLYLTLGRSMMEITSFNQLSCGWLAVGTEGSASGHLIGVVMCVTP